MTETWRPALDFEGVYEVSSEGRVRRIGRAPLKPQRDKRGYLVVDLVADGRRKNAKIHRLVATAFLPPKPGCGEVNHLDGDKANNAVSNLEWTDRSGNLKHAFNVLGVKSPTAGKFGELNHNAKTYRAVSPAGEVFVFSGPNEFCREHGLNPSNMSAVASGKRAHTKNWICEAMS